MIDLDSVKRIYFVGLGGIAMSATACIAKETGFEVLGSDSKEIYAPSKNVLDNAGLNYHIGYNAVNIKKAQADLFVLSAGETTDNPEVKFILENNLPRVSFPELLFELFRNRLRIVVAGTHGKSTTAGFLGHLLKNLDNSGFMVGAVLQNYESNFYLGDGHYFVFEGDEYKSQFDDMAPKFHYYKPDILILNNLEYDHPDLFESFESMKSEFAELIDKMPQDGLIVYNADDPEITKLVHKSNASSISFSINNEADFKVENIQYGEYTKFSVINKWSKDQTAKLLGLTEDYQIQLPGKINVYNALAVLATLRTLGFQPETISLDLLSYKGVKRRFEFVGEKNGITVIDDYAHHPTAVRETLKAARLKYPDKRIWAIFEPHTFSRTKATLPDLAKAFDAADEILISEIYPAREKISEAAISSKEVIDEIIKHNTLCNIRNTVRLVSDKKHALSILKNELKKNDIVIVMAVGSFNRLAYELKDNL